MFKVNVSNFTGGASSGNVIVKVKDPKSGEIELVGLIENKIICENCGHDFESYDLYKEHKLLNHLCTICERTFPVRRNLVRHVERIHSQKADFYTCRICSKLVNHFDNLLVHLRKFHTVRTEESVFKCSACPKSFKLRNSLYCHKKYVHGLGESVKCEICDKEFSHKYTLKAHHNSIHLGIKSVCPVCGESVRVLSSHMNIKHSKNLNLVCDVCGKKYSNKITLSLHKRSAHIYKPKSFMCEVCGASFKLKQLLKNHYVVHSDERNFKCDICNKTFKQKCVLQTHMRVHNNFEPYTCKCGQSFRWKSTYDQHESSCTSDT